VDAGAEMCIGEAFQATPAYTLHSQSQEQLSVGRERKRNTVG